MKKLMLKLALLLVPLLLILASLEYFSRQIPNDYKLKNQYILKNGSQIQTLILGNSHTMYGLNPSYFSSNTYNLAFLSQSLEYDTKLFDHYQNELKNTQVIILPISYYTLFSTMISDHNEWMLKYYAIYMQVPMNWNLSYHLEIASEPLKNCIRKNYDYYMHDTATILCSSNGWAKKVGQRKYNSIEQNAADAVKRHTFPMNKDFQFNLTILENFIQSAAKKNIQIILVTTPTQKYYADSIMLQSNYKVMQKKLQIIDSKYSNCMYINSLKDTSFVKEDFYDSDHLNENGAKKYSIYLDSILKQY
ncbi:MAG: hypothetical protein WCP57_09250 [Bacteroidota bacterium]